MKKLLIIFLSFSTAILFGQNRLSKKDSNFVRHAVDHTLFEIKLAETAQKKASTQEVKALASELLNYHSKALNELKQLALKKNISVSSVLGEKSQKYHDKIAKKEGVNFDKAYTKCAAKTHHMGSCFLKKESKKGKDTDITGWAAANYPTLEQLHKKAKTTCKTLKNKK